MTQMLQVGIDWGMDGHSVGNGQFRYAADLLMALAVLDLDAHFTVFGSRPTPPERVKAVFQSSNWRWVHKPVALGRGADWINQWRSFWVHRRQPLDVLHVIDAPIPAFAPCPVVATAYDLMKELFAEDYRWTANRGYKRWRWLSRNRVLRHLAISRTTASDLHKIWAIPESRIDVVYLGATGFPPKGFAETWQKTLADRFPELVGCRFLLSPYNLEPRKNLLALLKAVHALRDQFPDIKLVLFGKAAWTAEREAGADAQIANLGIGPVVMRTGFLDDADLAVLYRAAEVFVFPSLYEGFGLPVLEAMACGGCVVARNASAMSEILGDAGLAVETEDPDALAAGLVSLLNNPEEQRRLRSAAQARSWEFTTSRMARETFASYHRAVKKNG